MIGLYINGYDELYSLLYRASYVSQSQIQQRRKRNPKVCKVRAAFIMLCRDLPEGVSHHVRPSFPEIQREMICKNHSTTVTAYQKGQLNFYCIYLVYQVCKMAKIPFHKWPKYNEPIPDSWIEKYYPNGIVESNIAESKHISIDFITWE